MKVKIIIEEIVSQEFEVEVLNKDHIYEEVREKYKSGELVVEDPKLTQANVLILENYGRDSNWLDLHVN